MSSNTIQRFSEIDFTAQQEFLYIKKRRSVPVPVYVKEPVEEVDAEGDDIQWAHHKLVLLKPLSSGNSSLESCALTY
jgi:hypothetical protein